MQKHKYVLTVLEVLLIAYFAWRSFDFVVMSLQSLPTTMAYIVAAVYVAASDLAYLAWRHVAIPEATTTQQRSTATIMSWLLLACTVATTAGDTIMRNTLYQVNTAWVEPVLLFLPVFVVMVDAIGIKVYTEADSEHQLAMAEAEVEHAEIEAEMEVRRQAIRQIRSVKAEIADKAAPAIARTIRSRVEGRSLKRYDRALPEPTYHEPTITVKHSKQEPIPELEEVQAATRQAVMGTNGNGKGKARPLS